MIRFPRTQRFSEVIWEEKGGNEHVFPNLYDSSYERKYADRRKITLKLMKSKQFIDKQFNIHTRAQ